MKYLYIPFIVILSGCVSHYQVKGVTEKSPTVYIYESSSLSNTVEYSVLEKPCIDGKGERLAFLGSFAGNDKTVTLKENEKLIIKWYTGAHSSRQSYLSNALFEFTPENNKKYKLTKGIVTDAETGNVASTYKKLKPSKCT